MCLAIPSKIVKIDNGMGTIDVDGVRRTCSLLLVEDAGVGDWVIVHAGFALLASYLLTRRNQNRPIFAIPKPGRR